MPLSSQVADLFRESAARSGPVLPGDAKAHLLAAYERRGVAPASGLRLLLGGVRWSAAAISAAAAAVLVVFSGSLAEPSGSDASASSGSRELQAGLSMVRSAGASAAGVPVAGAFGAVECPIVWEQIHPFPSNSARVRVVDDQSLSLIGWNPDLDGP